MRLAYYAGASTAAAAACLLKAFHQRPNFYSATVYLSQSNACLLIITNLLLVMACGFMFALQRLLYGPLRPIEIEQLSEKAWYAVLDTLLAMPSFREEVGGWLLTMFVLLLAGKVWGWIGEGRVDILEQQPPANPRLFHARLASSLILSVLFGVFMLSYCIETVVADPRPGMMVIFTFEFAILCIFSSFTLMRYSLSVWEMAVVKKQTQEAIEIRKNEIKAEREAARQNATTEEGAPRPTSPSDEGPIEVDENEVDVPGWEEKRRYLFGLEVFTDFLKLVIYIVFFTVSITFNGLPMHIMRDVYMTFASFSKRVTDYVAYRKATSDMNARYPDATTEEIRDDACIVCRERMVAWELPNADGDAQPAAERVAAGRRRDEGLRAKKLPCGHILHLRCLKAWLERQQVCPTCRRPVISATTPENAAGGNGNPPAPGQPGRPQPQRPRARMFNLGPLRVGLLNAPNNQMQNILNQLQNPDAANQNAPVQQGPNHLGLQVPYANGAAGGGQGAATTATMGDRGAVPVNVQLMQLQQRIMQEAHNLRVEHQQLLHLRAMEAEVARLQTLHNPTQATGGASGLQGQSPPLSQHLAQTMPPGYVPTHPTTSLQHSESSQPSVQALHGVTAQQIRSGSENLPDGLVLPEGWTLMPLRRRDGNFAARNDTGASQLAPQYAGGADSSTPEQLASSTATGQSTALNATNMAEASMTSAHPKQDDAQHVGPTDDRGSPLFVPSQEAAADAASGPAPAQLTDEATPTTEQKTPWTVGDWSFQDQPGASEAVPATETAAEPLSTASNGHTREENDPQRGHAGKGKGKAVEIEDAPDADADS